MFAVVDSHLFWTEHLVCDIHTVLLMGQDCFSFIVQRGCTHFHNYSKTKQLNGSRPCLLFFPSSRKTDLLPIQAETSRTFPLVKGFRVQLTGKILLFYCCCPCCRCCCGGVSCYEVLELETEGPLWLNSVLWHQSHWGIFRHFCLFWHLCVRVSVPDIGQLPYPSHYIKGSEGVRGKKYKIERRRLEKSGMALKDECYISF